MPGTTYSHLNTEASEEMISRTSSESPAMLICSSQPLVGEVINQSGDNDLQNVRTSNTSDVNTPQGSYNQQSQAIQNEMEQQTGRSCPGSSSEGHSDSSSIRITNPTNVATAEAERITLSSIINIETVDSQQGGKGASLEVQDVALSASQMVSLDHDYTVVAMDVGNDVAIASDQVTIPCIVQPEESNTSLIAISPSTSQLSAIPEATVPKKKRRRTKKEKKVEATENDGSTKKKSKKATNKKAKEVKTTNVKKNNNGNKSKSKKSKKKQEAQDNEGDSSGEKNLAECKKKTDINKTRPSRRRKQAEPGYEIVKEEEVEDKNIFIPHMVSPQEFLECVCGVKHGAVVISEQLVQCGKCSQWQHASCVCYDLTDPYRGEYFCPHCHVERVSQLICKLAQ